MDMHHLIAIVDAQNTNAGIAYMTEGLGAPAMVLIVSWSAATAAAHGMTVIQLCKTWKITTDGPTLSIVGSGYKKTGPRRHIIPAFSSSWEMDDPDTVSFFEELARTHGYFLLLPAVDQVPGEGAPVVCYLGKNRPDVNLN